MKLHLDRPAGLNIVTAIGDGYVEINGQRHDNSLLLLPQQIEPGWGAAGFEALSETDFASIAAPGCEVLLFGTGRKQRFPHPSLLRPLMAARIGIEVMDTAAACRTYNILVAEGRNVAAALLFD
ncbi:MAG: Mth938-like domain-containing protein [Betaproteobacteria bacterium]|nr:Mth938-like domain-containing protein [Betaproteobacteria bacterium]